VSVCPRAVCCLSSVVLFVLFVLFVRLFVCLFVCLLQDVPAGFVPLSDVIAYARNNGSGSFTLSVDMDA
jgi:hypothetical protein